MIQSVLGLVTERFRKGVAEARDALKGLADDTKEGLKAGGSNALGRIVGDLAGIATRAGPAAAAIGAVVAVWNLAIKAIEQYRENLRIAADMAAFYVAEVDKTVSKNEEKRKSELESLEQLKKLNSAEKISNSDRLKAITLLDKLGVGYRNLAASIDPVTGKIANLDQLMGRTLENQKVAQIADYDSQIRAVKEQIKMLDVVFEGNSGWFGTGINGNPGAQLQSMQEQNAIVQKLQDLVYARADLLKTDPASDYAKEVTAGLDDAAQAGYDALQERLVEYDAARKKVWRDSMTDEEKMADRRQQIADEVKTRQSIATEMSVRVNGKYNSVNEFLIAEREVYALSAQYAESEQNQWMLQSEILKIERTRADEAKKKSEAARNYAEQMMTQFDTEARVTELKLRGLDDEAKRLQFIADLKARNAELSEDELANLWARRQALDKVNEIMNAKRPEMGGELIMTNQLARIGGWSSSVVDNSAAMVQQQMLAKTANMELALAAIKEYLPNLGRV